MDGSVQRLPVGAPGLRIGRVPGNEVVLPAPEVSRGHCRVDLAAGQAVLTDVGSTNGTVLDGVRIGTGVPMPLLDGARIVVGPFALTYRCGTAEQLQRAEALEAELRRARAYVESVLPPPMPEGPVRARWRFVPSAELGGDGFGYQRLADGRFCAWLLDVNGHGVGSALLAVSVMNLLRQPLMAMTDLGDPAAVLRTLYAMFPMEQHGGLCFSIWYGVFEPAARRLAYASAGQHPAYLRTADDAAPLQALATRNMPIGAAPIINVRAAEAAVARGSLLYLFSDGAFETTGPEGRQHGLDDFLPLLSAAPAEDEPERLLRAVRGAARPGPFADDVSLLTIAFD
jgi:serine phosphatase RsbU (regulator of sigma subunit)